ncbi:hypothetical protein T229_13585 [Tannerella sp. oral taxon BU063 isolate Cell 5]|uniref:Uncharacterized protein n=1 Tax=Tannerella sp. oral taxon BU063 isolate Cell 5 TaxID=1410950 RepID=W2CAX3_9BACT|nr:hypothetical protein T229_13585 [Tannerella sp. oral taxon BU063 isolate Cell 5]
MDQDEHRFLMHLKMQYNMKHDIILNFKMR